MTTLFEALTEWRRDATYNNPEEQAQHEAADQLFTMLVEHAEHSLVTVSANIDPAQQHIVAMAIRWAEHAKGALRISTTKPERDLAEAVAALPPHLIPPDEAEFTNPGEPIDVRAGDTWHREFVSVSGPDRFTTTTGLSFSMKTEGTEWRRAKT